MGTYIHRDTGKPVTLKEQTERHSVIYVEAGEEKELASNVFFATFREPTPEEAAAEEAASVVPAEAPAPTDVGTDNGVAKKK